MQPGWGLSNTGDFLQLAEGGYWSDTEVVAPYINFAWLFNTGYGLQTDAKEDLDYLAIAFRDGRAVVPEPASMILFGIGGVVLAASRKLSRRRG
jgi:hypothetical protein